jgi:hypothetical protein
VLRRGGGTAFSCPSDRAKSLILPCGPVADREFVKTNDGDFLLRRENPRKNNSSDLKYKNTTNNRDRIFEFLFICS